MKNYKKITSKEFLQIISENENEHIDVEECFIKGDVEIYDKNYEILSLKKCIISGRLKLVNTNIERLHFNDVHFIQIEGHWTSSPIEFHDCKISYVDFSELSSKTKKSKKENIQIDESLFNKRKESVNFRGCTLNTFVFSPNILDLTFSNCNIDSFLKPGSVIKEDEFYGSFKFDTCTFQKVYITNLTHTAKINFDCLQFRNSVFEKFISFQGMVIKDLTFHYNVTNHVVIFKDTDIKKADSLTYGTLKENSIRFFNKIQALKYHELEMTAFEKEQISFSDKILVLLNKYSSNHGANWPRGILFTITISFIFFFLYTYSLQNIPFKFGWNGWINFKECLSIFCKYFILYFYPAHEFDFMKDYNPRGISYLIDVSGRIMIGYGIYQTIQAFRKFGKIM